MRSAGGTNPCRCAQPTDLLPRWAFTILADLGPHGLNGRLPTTGLLGRARMANAACTAGKVTKSGCEMLPQ